MEITKVLKPFIRRGCQYFWQYSVYVIHAGKTSAQVYFELQAQKWVH